MRSVNDNAVVGFNIPAEVGMPLAEVCTPALIVDLDAFEQNVATLRQRLQAAGVRLRAHAKTHKSIDIARYQIDHGGACGICCQKVAEAEVMVAGGIEDVLVSNQVTDPVKIDRLARLARNARILVCVDDADNIDVLAAAASKHAINFECLVEIDCGAGRCGVEPGAAALSLAQKIAASDSLQFAGLQAYQGAAQHIRQFAERRQALEAAIAQTRVSVELLSNAGLECDIVAGAGTGSYYFEAASGIYNEMQCGSYIFMDADYQRVLDESGAGISEFCNSLFIWSSIMSTARAQHAVCDAGLKVISADSGLPVVYGYEDIEYVSISDEHGVLADPKQQLHLNQKLKLIPGHCDPTCNLHDWYVGIRDDRVECLWPVSARGLAF
ncbi:MAG: DSD1 family PLP-dependent enzyme [Gammaproteobacteria bacterium]|nr:MAG: DSD1 family PLP-dependent enzyme [Gammaproteobacteria bacterium]UCH38497.1 MAG: DSD1 family PLP-dependent enzyme [Gammaproteobacteria bacterium]